MLGSVLLHPSSELLLRWGANFGPSTVQHQWWRLVSCTFLHIGIVHLAVNMWALWSVGTIAEHLLGRLSLASLYLLCGIAASLASLAWHPLVVSAGASGAIFGLFGTLLVAFRFAPLALPKRAIRSATNSLLLFLVYNLVYGALKTGTDNAAHLGGLGAGLLLGCAAVFPRGKQQLRVPVSASSALAFLLVASTIALGHSDRYLPPLERGRALLGSNQPKAAIPELDTAVRLRPQQVESHLLLAQALLMTKQLPEAERELRQAVAVAPRFAEAWRRLGLFYLASGRAADASEAFRRASELAPRSATIAADYALALEEAKRLDDAIRLYEQALALDPHLEAARYGMGLAYLEKKQYDEAIHTFQQLTRALPASPDAFRALAAAYRGKGLNREAEQAADEARRLREQQAVRNGP